MKDLIRRFMLWRSLKLTRNAAVDRLDTLRMAAKYVASDAQAKILMGWINEQKQKVDDLEDQLIQVWK